MYLRHETLKHLLELSIRYLHCVTSRAKLAIATVSQEVIKQCLEFFVHTCTICVRFGTT